jgi:hypothetical protein
MKKWLKDNNLKAGSGAPIQDFSISGMHLTLISFIEALNCRGVNMTYETAADLLGLGDVMSPDGPLAETESGTGGFLGNYEDEEEGDDTNVIFTSTHDNISSMDQRKLKKKKSKKNSENNEFSTSSTDLPLSVNSSMAGLPSRLRPSIIDTSSSSLNMGSTLNGNETTNRLMNLLHELKSNSSSPQENNNGKGKNTTCGILKNKNNDPNNQFKKNQNDDLIWDSSGIHSFKNNSSHIYQKDNRLDYSNISLYIAFTKILSLILFSSFRDNSDIYNISYSNIDSNFDKVIS